MAIDIIPKREVNAFSVAFSLKYKGLELKTGSEFDTTTITKEVFNMEEFTIRLSNVKDSYYGFIVAVLSYVKKKTSRLEAVKAFMDEHPEALSSDILEFISDQEDIYEDVAYPAAKVG